MCGDGDDPRLVVSFGGSVEIVSSFNSVVRCFLLISLLVLVELICVRYHFVALVV